jgi:phage terminase large subunit-like protein
LILAGRGFGKTRTGAEWAREQIESGKCKRMIFVARTTDDARDVMVEGESGILAVCPPWNRPVWTPSTRMLRWPNGAIAMVYSADKPDILRGKQSDGAWADELGSWRYPDAWDQLMLGLRLGRDPRVVVTTTPKPTKLVKSLCWVTTPDGQVVKGENGLPIPNPETYLTSGSTYENRANLATTFINTIVQRYEGTRLGRQELYAEILDDFPGALWQRDRIDELRVNVAPALQRVVVAVDPAVTSNENSDETGIIVAGKGVDDHLYILDDRSLSSSPHGWASAAVMGYHIHEADRVIGETNNGGDMVETTLRTVDARIPYKGVHASRGKRVRAEPVAALYEQGKVHHVGAFAELEDQMCQWDPADSTADSPDRMDALVWAATELMLGGAEGVTYGPSLWG